MTEIDRAAFPTIWPPINYRNELQNRLAHYLVVCDEERVVENGGEEVREERGFAAAVSWVRRQLGRISGNRVDSDGGQYIVGFVGIWIMADEAHVINIAVREDYQRRGIGEILLVSAIDLALKLHARILTLEVRASNTVAQALYRKYGMTEVGLRRGYYVDNKEDAILMSTEDINSPSFQREFQKRKRSNRQRLGAEIRLSV